MSGAPLGDEPQRAIARLLRVVVQANHLVGVDLEQKLVERAKAADTTLADLDVANRAYARYVVDHGFESAPAERRAEREVVGMEEALGRAGIARTEQEVLDEREHLRRVRKRLDADRDDEIDRQRLRVFDDDVAARLPHAIHP